MPRIGKIRFINFTYNDNRHIYDQTFDFYNGEDTLLNLQNGGGKTVLVQMMMQPVIPGQKLKDRLFKSYFMNAKAPGYIMIEWILDGTNKRVMTGIGIKRVLGKSIEDDSGSIRIITFISEYEGVGSFDIKNIELTSKEKGMIKLIEFDRVVKSLSDAEKEGNQVWLYRWNIPDDKKEYSRRLTEYKINPSEWRNLMIKINEAEAGLNSFFNDCKTSKALVKKWFIPTIEDQLNKSGDFVENIKELIKNHAVQLVKNEDMLKEREIFEDFNKKSKDLLSSLKDYSQLQEKSDKNKAELGNACLFIDSSLSVFSQESEEALQNIRHIEDVINHLEYQRLSHEYYIIEDDLKRISQKINNISEHIASKKTEFKQLEYKMNLLACAKLNEELKTLNARISKFETELEKETLQQEDISSRINDIKYSLKLKYQEKTSQLETALKNIKTKQSEERNKLSDYISDTSEINRKAAILNDQLISIKSRINTFNESKAALQSIYPGFNPVRDIDTGSYSEESLNILKDGLAIEESDIEERLSAVKEKRRNSKDKLLLIEKECRELRDAHPSLAIEKNTKEAAYQLFHKDKQEIERIMRSYQLNEDLLFDKEKILIPLALEKEKYQKLVGGLNLENSIYYKQLKQYETGESFELSDDLAKIFDDLNIFFEFGHDWLRNLSVHKKVKLRLVRDNPFLPYALIVSSKDYKLMKDLDLKGILSPVIPVIEREKLESCFKPSDSISALGGNSEKDGDELLSNDIKPENINNNEEAQKVSLTRNGNHSYSLGGLHFLIAFDDRILNKNYLKELSEEALSKINKNNSVIEHAEEALNHITADIMKVEGFDYIKNDIDKLTKDIASIKDSLEESTLKIAAGEDTLASLKAIDMDDMSLQGSLENEKNKFIRKKEDILTFIKKCGQYSKDLADKQRVEDSLSQEASLLAEREGSITKLQKIINDLELQHMGISSNLEKAQFQYQKYADMNSGTVFDEEIESLESKLTSYISKVSGSIQSLQDILEDYKKQRDDKLKALNAYDIDSSFYINTEYRAFEYESLTKESRQITEHINELEAAKNEQLLITAERNSDLKYCIKNLTDSLNRPEPLPRDAIQELNYVQEKEENKSRLRDLEKKIAKIKTQENKLQRIRYQLEEYRNFTSGLSSPHAIEGNIDEYVLSLIKEYKEYAALKNSSKSLIAEYYQKLEEEFVPKSEMFKSLFNSILNGGQRYQPAHALNAFNRVFVQIERKLEQHYIDIKKIDDMEKYIIDNTLSYLRNVYDEMSQIDRNSTIDLDGRRLKMLIISLPETEALESISLKEYLKGAIMNCVDLSKNGKPMDGLLANEINTYNLFDRLVGVNKIGITLMKIEPNNLKKKTWNQVISENSGGELFVSAFVVFISLLTYMRGEAILNTGSESKVLIMDNPFGPITSEHLLKPLFEISKKYNTQMICLTDVKGHAIYDRFNLIYSLNIEREIGRMDEYIELKTIKKDVIEKEDEILSASMFKIEDKSRFELVN